MEKIYEEYEKVKDKISQEDFIAKFNSLKEEYADMEFMDDSAIIDMITGSLVDEKVEPISESLDGSVSKISDFEPGNHDIQVVGRIMAISNPKLFTSRKGKDGKLCNIQLADDTGDLRVVLWTENIKLLKYVNEGDIVLLTGVECKEGYRGGKELHMSPRSGMKTIDKSNEAYPLDTDFNLSKYSNKNKPIRKIRIEWHQRRIDEIRHRRVRIATRNHGCRILDCDRILHDSQCTGRVRRRQQGFVDFLAVDLQKPPLDDRCAADAP